MIETTSFSSQELTDLRALALTVTREAADFVKQGYRSRPRVEHKGPVDLVTEYDQQCEVLLRARLHESTSFAVVGEETGETSSGAGSLGAQDSRAVWYVDPIDGTTNFVHGHPFYCVSVGLAAQDGTPLLGVVVAPSLFLEWTGIVPRAVAVAGASGGATRNGEVCHVSANAALEQSLLATGFPYHRAGPDNNFDAFVALKTKCQAIRRCGSAALDLCLVADGTYDGYWERGLKPWDIAAGAAIVQSAGGNISGYQGTGSSVTSGDIVASNGHIHATLVHELQHVLAQRGSDSVS